jgi:hypothetical protein
LVCFVATNLLAATSQRRYAIKGDIQTGTTGKYTTPGLKPKIKLMANLTLVYGMRLLPSDEVAELGDATLKLKNGREAHVTMHVLEGSKEEIEKQLKTSLEAFFDFYPEI